MWCTLCITLQLHHQHDGCQQTWPDLEKNGLRWKTFQNPNCILEYPLLLPSWEALQFLFLIVNIRSHVSHESQLTSYKTLCANIHEQSDVCTNVSWTDSAVCSLFAGTIVRCRCWSGGQSWNGEMESFWIWLIWLPNFLLFFCFAQRQKSTFFGVEMIHLRLTSPSHQRAVLSWFGCIASMNGESENSSLFLQLAKGKQKAKGHNSILISLAEVEPQASRVCRRVSTDGCRITDRILDVDVSMQLEIWSPRMTFWHFFIFCSFRLGPSKVELGWPA